MIKTDLPFGEVCSVLYFLKPETLISPSPLEFLLDGVEDCMLVSGPFGGDEKGAGSVAGEPVDGDVLRGLLENSADQVHVLVKAHQRAPVRVHGGEGSVLHHVEHVQLYAEGMFSRHIAGGGEHVLSVFAGKPQYQVGDVSDAPPRKLPHRPVIYLQWVAAVYEPFCRLVDGLKPQLDPRKGLFIVFGKKIQHRLRQTVGPGGDGKSRDVWVGEGVVPEGAQPFSRRVGVGVVLKVGDVPRLGPFSAEKLHLLGDGPREIAAAAGRTEDAASRARGPVPVGTGEAPVQ